MSLPPANQQTPALSGDARSSNSFITGTSPRPLLAGSSPSSSSNHDSNPDSSPTKRRPRIRNRIRLRTPKPFNTTPSPVFNGYSPHARYGIPGAGYSVPTQVQGFAGSHLTPKPPGIESDPARRRAESSFVLFGWAPTQKSPSIPPGLEQAAVHPGIVSTEVMDQNKKNAMVEAWRPPVRSPATIVTHAGHSSQIQDNPLSGWRPSLEDLRPSFSPPTYQPFQDQSILTTPRAGTNFQTPLQLRQRTDSHDDGWRSHDEFLGIGTIASPDLPRLNSHAASVSQMPFRVEPANNFVQQWPANASPVNHAANFMPSMPTSASLTSISAQVATNSGATAPWGGPQSGRNHALRHQASLNVLARSFQPGPERSSFISSVHRGPTPVIPFA